MSILDYWLTWGDHVNNLLVCSDMRLMKARYSLSVSKLYHFCNFHFLKFVRNTANSPWPQHSSLWRHAPPGTSTTFAFFSVEKAKSEHGIQSSAHEWAQCGAGKELVSLTAMGFPCFSSALDITQQEFLNRSNNACAYALQQFHFVDVRKLMPFEKHCWITSLSLLCHPINADLMFAHLKLFFKVSAIVLTRISLRLVL